VNCTQGSSLARLQNCDLELVLCIVTLLPPLFAEADVNISSRLTNLLA
jgi:hypothetical protein